VGGAPDLSVIIPTIPDRGHYLQRCLVALSRCRGAERTEVIVVTEKPGELDELIRQWRLPRIPVLVSAGSPLTAKRNAGVRAARADVIAFLDDDTEPEPGYVSGLLEAFAGGAEVVAGRVEPDFEAPVPAHLEGEEDLIRGFNALGDWRRTGYVIGANLAFRRVVFDRFGLFDPDFGRGGSRCDHGEESEFVIRVSSSFAPLFSEAACVRHAIQPYRVEPRYLYRRSWEAGRTSSAIDELHRRDYPRNTISVALQLPVLVLRALRHPRAMRPRTRLLFLLGYVMEGLRFLARGRGGRGSACRSTDPQSS
jgi:glycosyltransferase involved in cell wall biosynthesis